VVNRTQMLVLAFFLVVPVSVIVMRVGAPEIYDEAFRLPSADRQLEAGFLAAVTTLILLDSWGLYSSSSGSPWSPATAGPASGEPSTRLRRVRWGSRL